MLIAAKVSGSIADSHSLKLLSLVAKDKLSIPFEYLVSVGCEDSDLKLSDFLGQSMAIEIEVAGSKRQFHGLVAELVLTEKKHPDFFVYEVVLRPWFWFLSHNQDSRIFQGLNAVQIFEAVCRDYGGIVSLDKKLSISYPVREYCVQYRESDMNFLGRLMVQEGIYYFFRHTAQGHEMVLCDAASSHHRMKGFEVIPYIDMARATSSILKWRSEVKVKPTSVQLGDFDFLRPEKTMLQSAEFSSSHKQKKYEVFDYPGDYQVPERGAHYAQVRAQAQQVGFALASGETDALSMCCGYTFKAEGLPNAKEDGEYLVCATQTFIGIEADTNNGVGLLRCGFQVMPCSHVFRPTWKGYIPQIHGPQTAMVVGPKGQPVHTDEHGRVKVLFHWDREGGQRRDEQCSCWIRVSQPWAGQAFGMVNIPRLGDEVVVSFLDGNPDRPLITGRVYNEMSRAPYALPEHASITGMRTRSMGVDAAEQANELRFEDAKGNEYVWLQAQKDFHRWVKNNDHETVQANQLISIQGERKESVGKAWEQTVGGDVKTSYGRDHHHKVAGDWISGAGRAVNVSAGTDVAVSGVNVHVKAKANLTLEAGAMLTLKVGGASVVLSPAGISIDGVLVKINSGGSGSSASAPAQPQAAEKPPEDQDPLFGKA